uniref:Uncharacterized protein n=1 Tax=Rhizophora mucronata TaxID=61149 RepID=A0A2P2QDX0_RHIMU
MIKCVYMIFHDFWLAIAVASCFLS